MHISPFGQFPRLLIRRQAWLLVVLLTLFNSPAQATTLLGISIDELVDKAELIFQGQVIASQSVEDTAGQISTFVTFNVVDVIKGDYDGDVLELEFMGGIANGRIMEVSGLRMPILGETGIYFVESLSTNLINPLLGWSQGHYLVQQDEDGILRITTTDNTPVTQIQPVSQIPLLIRRPQAMLEGQTDAAAGVVTETSALTIERAMEVEEFKSRLRELRGNPIP